MNSGKCFKKLIFYVRKVSRNLRFCSTLLELGAALVTWLEGGGYEGTIGGEADFGGDCPPALVTGVVAGFG